MNTSVRWTYCGEPYEIEDGIPHYDNPNESGDYLVTYRNGSVYVDEYDADDGQW